MVIMFTMVIAVCGSANSTSAAALVTAAVTFRQNVTFIASKLLFIFRC
jgi:hypothetical protein